MRLEDMKVQLGVLAEYYEGSFRGKWYSFPLHEGQIEEDFGRSSDEIFSFDYEGFPPQLCWGRYDVITLDVIYGRLEALDPFLLENLEEILEAGYELEDLERIGNDFYFYEGCFSMVEVAKQRVLLGRWDVSEFLRPYLDYEAIGRDLETEGNFVVCENGVLELPSRADLYFPRGGFYVPQ